MLTRFVPVVRRFDCGMIFPVVLGLVPTPHTVTPAQKKMTITGGADPTGHNYSWTVTNRYSSPIVYLGFPQHHADLFLVPEGWSRDTTPDLCVARAASPVGGIGPGRDATFRLRVSPAGARRGRGAVLVRFADGTSATLDGVELPQADGAGDQYVPLIGLGLILLVLIVVQARRLAKPDCASPTSPDDPP